MTNTTQNPEDGQPLEAFTAPRKAAAKKAPAKKAAAVKKAGPRYPGQNQVKAADVQDQVLAAIKKHGKGEGVTLAKLAEVTGLRARVLSNVVWTLQGKPGSKNEGEARVKDVSENRTKRFVVVG
jgi:hypothetical protein